MSATINAANFLMLSVFGIAAIGYLLGRITIKGISLGTAGVFVIALVYGAFFGTHFNSRFVIEEINYASQALKIIENLGLVFFVTSVGFIAGPNFFKNMKHNFKSYVLLGIVIILSGGLTAVLCLFIGRAIEAGQPGYDPNQLTAMISGLLAGSLTTGKLENLDVATGDCLHQPYRFGLIENGEDIVREAKKLGALGAFISGAGPSIVAIVYKGDRDYITRAQELCEKLYPHWKAVQLRCDEVGATVKRL